MKNHLILTLLFLSPLHVEAGLTLGVTEVPTSPNGYFAAIVKGGPPIGELNPCWKGDGRCTLSFYTIDEDWLPAGMQGYGTADKAGFSTPLRPNNYLTVNEWWAAVTNKDRVGRDYLPVSRGDQPCVVVAAGLGGIMISGSIISNCAKGIVQAASCDVKPNSINVDLRASLGGAAPTVDVNNVTLTCTSDASVLIETNNGERIPLGGSSDSYALLDWGAGFGEPRTVKARRNVAEKLPLRVRGVALDLLGAGQFTGSAIVNVSYN
ncbi:hypothetical protein [Serratia sp. S4]|uniref:hypothetical protein n=1 Tax=Serratia sp. S4 TaxID=768491 RepID=UPI00037E4217|nr:hypothetical protein [Serratia sp. S4]